MAGRVWPRVGDQARISSLTTMVGLHQVHQAGRRTPAGRNPWKIAGCSEAKVSGSVFPIVELGARHQITEPFGKNVGPTCRRPAWCSSRRDRRAGGCTSTVSMLSAQPAASEVPRGRRSASGSRPRMVSRALSLPMQVSTTIRRCRRLDHQGVDAHLQPSFRLRRRNAAAAIRSRGSPPCVALRPDEPAAADGVELDDLGRMVTAPTRHFQQRGLGGLTEVTTVGWCRTMGASSLAFRAR